MEEECEECEEGAPAWMATFSDMATLLLTFFVLLLSFANMDIQNFKSALGSVKEAFGVQTETKGDHEARASSLMEWSDDPPSAMVNDSDSSASTEVKRLREYIEQQGMKDQIEVLGTQSGIVLRVKDVALFDTGSDRLTEASKPVLDLVEGLFKKSRAVLSIEGHTDNIPISRTRFPSNWELSAARAAAVLRHYLTHSLDKKRLSLSGYGELRPIASNATLQGRNKNRRVEFVFKREPGYRGYLFQLDDDAKDDSSPSGSASSAPSSDTPTSPGPTKGIKEKGSPVAADQPSALPSARTEAALPSPPGTQPEIPLLKIEKQLTQLDENGWVVPREPEKSDAETDSPPDPARNIRLKALGIPQEDFEWKVAPQKELDE